ncbi:MAG: hypothetical protein MN733_43440 [Nitrososphaera sp.]|nr:hypothetical protein [Nitrososphaera sp.]
MARATLDRIDQKLDDVIKRLDDHSARFSLHVEEDKKVHIIVDRLMQNEIRRVWQIRALWASVVGGVITFVTAYFTRIFS